MSLAPRGVGKIWAMDNSIQARFCRREGFVLGWVRIIPLLVLLYTYIAFYRGGGRGIVELEVLRAIENALGGKIPVQRFFDLIVGTR